MNTVKFKKFAALAAVCLIWGTTWIAIKYSLAGIQPFLGAALRFALAAICLYGYARYKNISLKLPPGSLKLIIGSAVFLYLIDYGLIYWSEQYLYAGVTAVFFATYPLFTGLVSSFLFRSEAFRWQKFAGLILALGGIGLIFYDQLLVTRFSGMVLWASIAIVSSALAAAISLVMVKKHLAHLETVSLTWHQMLWGIPMLVIAGFSSGETMQMALSVPFILSLLYLAIFGSAVAFVLYYDLLKKMSAVSLSSTIYVTPLIAIATGWLFLGEKITFRVILGTLIIFSGIAWATLKPHGVKPR